jgi:hypothetical protein
VHPIDNPFNEIFKEYGTTGDEYLELPVDVEIEPFLKIRTPRFGDVIGVSKALNVVWRDSRVSNVSFELFEASDFDSPFVQVGGTNAGVAEYSITASEKKQKSFSKTFHQIYKQAVGIEPDTSTSKVYKVVARICDIATSCIRPPLGVNESAIVMSELAVTVQ